MALFALFLKWGSKSRRSFSVLEHTGVVDYSLLNYSNLSLELEGYVCFPHCSTSLFTPSPLLPTAGSPFGADGFSHMKPCYDAQMTIVLHLLITQYPFLTCGRVSLCDA